jgi:glycerate 2-kinase
MARAFGDAWTDDLAGLVVTRYGQALPTTRIEVVEASHPVPDAAEETAARHILERVQGLTADDLVVCLISGGG